jgi:hypothetical protein
MPIMRRIAVAAVTVLTMSGFGVLAQQGDPIEQRQNLMKNNQEQVRTLSGDGPRTGSLQRSHGPSCLPEA